MKSKLKVRRSGQVFLPGLAWKKKDVFGGGNSHTTHPTSARPFHSKADLHIVIRSEKARGKLSLLRHDTRIGQKVHAIARKVFVEVKDYANVGNHIHLRVRARSRDGLNAFLRAITGVIARIVAGRDRGWAAGRGARRLGAPAARATADVGSGPFWDARPFSRIVSAATDVQSLAQYFELNRVERETGFSREMSRELLAIYQEQGRWYGNGIWATSSG